MTDPDMIIWHGGCWDGWAAAQTAYRAVVLGSVGHQVPILHGGHYGAELPDGVDGQHVLIVDFSYRPDQMIALVERAASVVWLDHHRSAWDTFEAHGVLGGLSAYRYDPEHSGAMLTWQYFHPDAPAPWPIRYVEDRDLWRFELWRAEDVQSYIWSRPMTAHEWDELLRTGVNDAAEAGRHIFTFRRQMIANIADTGFWARVGDHEIPMACSTYGFGSDVAARLIEVTGAPIAGYVLLNSEGQHQYGLRSIDGVDCSEIAKQFGGGGHQQASGFTSDGPAHVYLGRLSGAKP